MKKHLLVILLLVMAAIPATAAEKLTYVDLIERLTDLERLAILPSPGEKCGQWSSYDRASRYDAKSGKYVGWDRNGDGNGFIRKEGEAYVLAEMEGPGCIWRIWSARAGGGHVRIYLDGADEPAVDLPFIGYFDCKNEPFVYPSLVHQTAKGMNCYVPIPYQKSCKVVADEGWGKYYHFTYATYPRGTVVPTFKRGLSAEETAALKRTEEFLSHHLGTDPAGRRTGEITDTKTVEVSANEAVTLAHVTGPRAVTAIKVKVNPAPDEDVGALLREVVLRISWDGEEGPSVWAPLGDFFGTAPGINTYKSLPLGMTEDGFYSYWYMPFEKTTAIELVNEGSRKCRIEFSITHAPLSRPAGQLGRFHAKWHRDALLPADPERKIDWTMVKTEGRGRYCGVMLHVWNPRGRWWGEGDEKFFVDSEKFPSTFGTGSEDYFGYAWCTPALFQNAYHNQTYCTGNRGHISVNRWHIADNAPFQKSFEGYIEKYFPNDRPTLYACTAYWYLAPGGFDPYKPVAVAERTGYYGQLEIKKVPGALEGEGLKILQISGGTARTQDMAHFGEGWSNDAHLWWTGAKPGDSLVLALPVEQSGKYELKAYLTKARDYGIIRLLLDGKELGGPIDLYDPAVVPTGELSFGTHELDAGVHKLTVEIVGANEKALKRFMFGLDCAKLEPAE